MNKEYHRQKSKEHYEKFRETYRAKDKRIRQRAKQIIDECKSEGCILCNEKELCALDFHHLDNKEYTIAAMSNYSEKILRAEIAKCVVLCANCHRKVHAGLLKL